MLTLSIHDLNMMKNELYEAYTEVFNNSLSNLRRIIRIKLKAIRYSNKYNQINDKYSLQVPMSKMISKKFLEDGESEQTE